MSATLTAFTRQSTYQIDGGMLDLHYRDGVVSLERWPDNGSRPIVFDRGEGEELAKDILTESVWLADQMGAAHEEGEEVGKQYGYEEGYGKALEENVNWAEDLLESVGEEDNLAASVAFRVALEKFVRRER